MYSAKRRNSVYLIVTYVVFAALILWSLRHIESIVAITNGQNRTFGVIYVLSFVVLAWQTLLYSLERPYKTTLEQQNELNKLRVIVNVPIYNEDPDALYECIKSIYEQTRPVNVIHAVINGNNKIDYSDVKYKLESEYKHYDTIINWTTQAIAGKRQAQATTAKLYLRPQDIFLTVDSDAYLDSKAVMEGLKPFVKPKVMSVAGIVLTINNKRSKLARMSDLWFLVGQLVDRSANSTLGAVLVNSGVLAFYRGHVILDNLSGYTNEIFFGRPVEFSDDSLLTIYALNVGKAVQQPTSFAFTLMPETMSHHFRQQLRWMRGAFIRSWWRFKYLRLNGYAYWSHLLGWVQMVLSTTLFIYLFMLMPVVDGRVLPYLLLIPILVGYGQALRYLMISRSDESFLYRFTTYLCEPIPALWSFFVLRFVRYYAMATCLKTGWGTRSEVEVGINT